MKRSAPAKSVLSSSKRVRADLDDDFYASDEDRRLSAFMKAASGEDFYDSDEDRRLCEFAGGARVSPADVEENRAGDDFVALYDGWEEDMEDIVIITDEGDDTVCCAAWWILRV